MELQAPLNVPRLSTPTSNEKMKSRGYSRLVFRVSYFLHLVRRIPSVFGIQLKLPLLFGFKLSFLLKIWLILFR